MFMTHLSRRFKISVLSLTYVAYVCYHMTRKPIAVVKSVLHRNCSDLPRPSHFNELTVHDDDTWCDYAPFGESPLARMLRNLLIIRLCRWPGRLGPSRLPRLEFPRLLRHRHVLLGHDCGARLPPLLPLARNAVLRVLLLRFWLRKDQRHPLDALLRHHSGPCWHLPDHWMAGSKFSPEWHLHKLS